MENHHMNSKAPHLTQIIYMLKLSGDKSGAWRSTQKAKEIAN